MRSLTQPLSVAAASPIRGVAAYYGDGRLTHVAGWGGTELKLDLPGAVLCPDGQRALEIDGNRLSLVVLAAPDGPRRTLQAASREHFDIPMRLVELCDQPIGPWTPMWPEDGPDVAYDPSASLYPESVRRWESYWFDFPTAEPPIANLPHPLVAVTAEEAHYTTTDGITGPGNLQIWDTELDLPLSPIWRFPAKVKAVAFRPDAVRVLTADGEVRDVPFRRVPAAAWMSSLDDLVGQRGVEDATGLAILLGWDDRPADPGTYNADFHAARDAAATALRTTREPDALAIVGRLESLAAGTDR